MSKYQIKRNRPIPMAKLSQGQLGEIEKVVAKMRVKDSIEFDTYLEMLKFMQRARRYSRWYKKNQWRFQQSQVGGLFIWRVA